MGSRKIWWLRIQIFHKLFEIPDLVDLFILPQRLISEEKWGRLDNKLLPKYKLLSYVTNYKWYDSVLFKVHKVKDTGHNRNLWRHGT